MEKTAKQEKGLKVKETAGITMIALVITIIVLLILAAISVTTLTGENGILAKAQEAKIATEKAAIEEQLRLAQLSAKTQAMGGPIDIQDILDELDKAGVDYEVIEGEGGGTTIIIDGEYIYDIIDKEGDIEFETQGTVDKPMPRILTLEANYEENTIKVKVTTKENEEGTLEFYIKEENDTDYTKKETVEQAPAEYEYLFEEIDVTKVYQIKVVAIAKNGERKEKEITVVGIPTLNSSNTIFSYTPTSYIKENVTVTITTKNINMAGYTLQYAIDNPEVESNWKNYTTGIAMQQNGEVYARLKDRNKGQVGRYAKIGSITNIDRDGPVFKEEPTATATTNSITIAGSPTDDKSGVKEYQYYCSTDGTNWTESKVITDNSYTFNELTQDTPYSLKMRAIDNLGNDTTTNPIPIRTDRVPELIVAPAENANTTFRYFDVENNEELPTNGYTESNIKVVIETTIDGYTLQYKTQLTGEVGEVSEWTDYPTEGITISRNQEIYARVVDSTKQSAATNAKEKLNKIDREGPTFVPSSTRVVSVTSNSITVTAQATDTVSGLKGYKYCYSTDGNNWIESDITDKTSYPMTGLVQNTTYSLKVIAIDNLDHETTSNVWTQKTNQVTGLTTGANGNVTFTYTPIAANNLTSVDGYGASMKVRITTTVTGYDLQYKTQLSGNAGETTTYQTISNGRRNYLNKKSDDIC